MQSLRLCGAAEKASPSSSHSLKTPCNLIVRSASLDDIDKIEKIEKASFDRPYPRWYLELLVELANGKLVVAELCGRIVGYAAAVTRLYKTCHLVTIAVDPAWRRKGIGASLLASIEELCAQEGAETVALEVEATNTPALEMYKKFGYSQARILPNYYGEGRHALLMVKTV